MEAAQSSGTYLPTYQPKHIKSHLYNYNLNHSTGFEGINNHRKLYQNNQSKVGFELGVYHTFETLKTVSF